MCICVYACIFLPACATCVLMCAFVCMCNCVPMCMFVFDLGSGLRSRLGLALWQKLFLIRSLVEFGSPFGDPSVRGPLPTSTLQSREARVTALQEKVADLETQAAHQQRVHSTLEAARLGEPEILETAPF